MKNADSKQFKSEVTETDLFNNDKVEQPVVQDNQNKNEDTKGASQTNDGIVSQKGEVQAEPTPNASTEVTNTTEAKEKPIETKIKDGRGRKPLSPEEKEKRANEKKAGTGSKEVSDQQNSLDDLLDKYKQVPQAQIGTQVQTNQPQQPVNPKADYIDMSKYVSGALFLIAIDIIMPTLSMTIAGFIDKRYKHIDKKHLKLTTDEKKELEPIAEQVVKVLFGYVHPVVAFGVMLSIMYMGKVMMISDSVLDDAEMKMNKKLALKKKGGK
jgi:hypothetical protein